MENFDENPNEQKINILKYSSTINPSINNKLISNKTISKLNSPKNVVIKKDNKSQTITNFLFQKIFSKYNIFNNRKEKYISSLKRFHHLNDFFNEENDSICNNKNIFSIHSIQLDNKHLRLISTRNIQGPKTSLLDNIKNNSKLFNIHYINSQKKRTDIVKYKFLLSKKNYYKRISDLKENSLFNKNDLNDLELRLKLFKTAKTREDYLFLKPNNNYIKVKRDKADKDHSSLPSVHKILYDQINRNNLNISSKIKNNKKNCKICLKKHKFDLKKKSINKNIDRKLQKIINDNYKEYLNDISGSDSNKSERTKEPLTHKNKQISDKIFFSKINRKVIFVKNRLFNLDKNSNNLDISSKENGDEEKCKLDVLDAFFPDKINSVYKIKKNGKQNDNFREINKNNIVKGKKML